MTKTFIHIGMGKAGSTFLQEYFKKHSSVILGNYKTYSIPDMLFNNSVLNPEDKNTQFNISKSKNNLNVNVISDERIGFFRTHTKIGCKYHKSQFTEEWIKAIRDIYYDVYPNAEILLINRKLDEEYIKSCYNQSIKSGYDGNEDEFTNEINDFIKKVSKVREIWSEKFKVHSIDYAHLKRDPENFLNLINQTLNIPKISNIKFNKINKSKTQIEIKLIKNLNKIANKFISNKFVYKYYLKIVRKIKVPFS